MGIASYFVGEYSSLMKKFSVIENRTINRWVLNLPGAGCSHWKQHGGCAMCGFHVATRRYNKGFLLPGVIFKLLYVMAERFYKESKPSELLVYNGGSFWNDKEIPRNFQHWFFQNVSSHDSMGKVLIENRCEYITLRKIHQAVELLGNKKLYVGIGLESADDFLRNVIIRKGLSRKFFEEKVKLLNNNGAFAMAYVFLKPMGLSDRLALKDVLATIDYALSMGVSEIDVSCAFVQRKTEMERQYLSGAFSPPRLEVIIELIDDIITHNWPVNIAGFDDYPPPIAIPRNCDKCSGAYYDAIEMFRQKKILGDIPTCDC
ncbi:MAG: hypothetical protein ACD_37C00295G0002 [uncultured bacterium]|nr:MAG: hypothetical protein ACD_37C00295G0002 [uncultured bacterium]